MNSVTVKHNQFDSTKRVGLVIFRAAVQERNADRLDGYLIHLPGERREFSRCGDVMLMLCEELAEHARYQGRDISIRRSSRGQCLISLA